MRGSPRKRERKKMSLRKLSFSGSMRKLSFTGSPRRKLKTDLFGSTSSAPSSPSNSDSEDLSSSGEGDIYSGKDVIKRDKIKREHSFSFGKEKRDQREKMKREREMQKLKEKEEKLREKEEQKREKLKKSLYKTDKEATQGKMESLRQAGETSYDNIANHLTALERLIERQSKIDEVLTEKVKEMSLYIHRFASVTITTTVSSNNNGESSASPSSSSSSAPPFSSSSKSIYTSTSYRMLPATNLERVSSAVWSSLDKDKLKRECKSKAITILSSQQTHSELCSLSPPSCPLFMKQVDTQQSKASFCSSLTLPTLISLSPPSAYPYFLSSPDVSFTPFLLLPLSLFHHETGGETGALAAG